MNFQRWLAKNNSDEEQWGVWVNPRDVQDYRIGQYCFENGGILDDWAHIGSIESLAYERRLYTGEEDGYSYLIENNDEESILFKGKIVRFSREGLAKLYGQGDSRLNPEFVEAIEKNLDLQCEQFSQEWAEQKIEELKKYFAPGGEYEQEQKELAKELAAQKEWWEAGISA